MSKDDFSFQSGRTKAIDLEELEARSAKKRKPADDGWGAEKWDDPWTADQPKQRRWAEDERWTGDEPEAAGPSQQMGQRTCALDINELGGGGEPDDDWGGAAPKASRGWTAPKRDEVLASGQGWDDWNDDGSGTMSMSLDDLEEQKELGGRRKKQAAASYENDDRRAYGDGHARRKEIYKSKEDLEYGDHAQHAYAVGQRQIHGEQMLQADDDWSSNVDRQRPAAPAAPAAPQVLDLGERTVALDLSNADFDSPSPGVLAPNQRTTALNGEDERFQQQARQASSPNEIPGPTLASVVIFSPNIQPVVYELKLLSTSVGRGLENDLVITDPYASRKHLFILYRNGYFEVQDAGTDNGTTINGQPITHALLRPGDHIELGGTVLRFVPGIAGHEHMHFAPPPMLPPQHLAPPPGGAAAIPASAVAMVPQQSSRGLFIALILAGLLLLAAGASVAIYFFVFADTKSAASASQDTDSTVVTTGSMDTGYVPVGTDNSLAVRAEAAEAHRHLATQADEPAPNPTPETPNAQETPEPQAALRSLTEDDRILVAGLAGSIAMANGKTKPAIVTIAGESITLKIDSDPIDAAIYNPDGTLRGRTPYHVTEIKNTRVETWTVKKDGMPDQSVEVDFNEGIDTTIRFAAAKAPVKSSSTRTKSSSSSRSSSKSQTNVRRTIPIVD